MEQAHRLSEIREVDWLAPLTREALHQASAEARALHSELVYPEHLLLGLLALEGEPLGLLFRANNLSIAQIRKRVQERFVYTAGPSASEESVFSGEAQECLHRAVVALISDPPEPGASKQVSPELLALSLFANSRVQHILASVATLAILVHARLVEQMGSSTFQRIERRFLFARSPSHEERISLQYVTIGQQRRILKSVEPPQYRFRDLAGLGPLHRDVQGLVSLLGHARRMSARSRALLLIEPPGKRVKQLVRAIAGEAGTPLTIVFCPVLAEIWQEGRTSQQPATVLRELFLSLRLLSTSLIYLEDLDALAKIDEKDEVPRPDEPEEQDQEQPGEQREDQTRFWPAFLVELDKLLARSGVVLLAATRKPEELTPELLTQERLGHGLVVDVPAVIEASERAPARPPTGKKARQPAHPAPRLLCSACHQPMQAHWLHCVYCGAAVAQHCPNCGSPKPELAGARFCFHCGHQFT